MNDQTVPAKSILVVEDQELLVMLIANVIKGAGYQLDSASNGQEAIAKLRDGYRPDLILLDVVMPVMDGYEFLDVMHEDASLRDIPVIMLTALDHAEDVIKALKRGAVDYCTKPIEPDDLLATITRIIGTS